MPEEASHPFGLGARSANDRSVLAAAQEAPWLKDKDVIDVNGLSLGKVARAFSAAGTLTRFDVQLTHQARQIFGEGARDVAGVPGAFIQRVEGDEVRLNQAAEAILHPEDPQPAHAEIDERGAPELPRKDR